MNEEVTAASLRRIVETVGDQNVYTDLVDAAKRGLGHCYIHDSRLSRPFIKTLIARGFQIGAPHSSPSGRVRRISW